jgi:hypothetical protein
VVCFAHEVVGAIVAILVGFAIGVIFRTGAVPRPG